MPDDIPEKKAIAANIGNRNMKPKSVFDHFCTSFGTAIYQLNRRSQAKEMAKPQVT